MDYERELTFLLRVARVRIDRTGTTQLKLYYEETGGTLLLIDSSEPGDTEFLARFGSVEAVLQIDRQTIGGFLDSGVVTDVACERLFGVITRAGHVFEH